MTNTDQHTALMFLAWDLMHDIASETPEGEGSETDYSWGRVDGLSRAVESLLLTLDVEWHEVTAFVVEWHRQNGSRRTGEPMTEEQLDALAEHGRRIGRDPHHV